MKEPAFSLRFLVLAYFLVLIACILSSCSSVPGLGKYAQTAREEIDTDVAMKPTVHKGKPALAGPLVFTRKNQPSTAEIEQSGPPTLKE